MVAKAAKRVEGLSNATAAQADAFNMPEVPSDSVDVVTCCYG
jgi:ubiquinone/menaquinone biosynthesis C-methylase UbiE